MQIGVIMKPLMMYGQGDYVKKAIPELVSLAVQFYERMEGIERPYHVNHELLHW